MFNNHTVRLITEPGEPIDPNMECVMFITNTYMPTGPNQFNSSVLMPPVDILMAVVDGDPGAAYYYNKYLAETKICNDMIICILAKLTQCNIALFIPTDDFNMFGRILLDFIYFNYGIICATNTTQFSIDSAKVPFIITRFYDMDIMPAEEYIKTYPANAALPMFIIPKLASEINTNGEDPVAFFNRLNASKGYAIDNPNMVAVVR